MKARKLMVSIAAPQGREHQKLSVSRPLHFFNSTSRDMSVVLAARLIVLPNGLPRSSHSRFRQGGLVNESEHCRCSTESEILGTESKGDAGKFRREPDKIALPAPDRQAPAGQPAGRRHQVNKPRRI
jgi:hypothetical protein